MNSRILSELEGERRGRLRLASRPGPNLRHRGSRNARPAVAALAAPTPGMALETLGVSVLVGAAALGWMALAGGLTAGMLAARQGLGRLAGGSRASGGA